MEKPVGSVHARHTKLSSDDGALTLFRKSNKKTEGASSHPAGERSCNVCMLHVRAPLCNEPSTERCFNVTMSWVAVYWMPSTHLPFWVSLYCQCTWKWETLVLMVLDERLGETWHNAAHEHLMTVESSVLYTSVEYLTTVPSVAYYTPLFSSSVNTVSGILCG